MALGPPRNTREALPGVDRRLAGRALGQVARQVGSHGEGRKRVSNARVADRDRLWADREHVERHGEEAEAEGREEDERQERAVAYMGEAVEELRRSDADRHEDERVQRGEE